MSSRRYRRAIEVCHFPIHTFNIFFQSKIHASAAEIDLERELEPRCLQASTNSPENSKNGG